MIICRWNMKEKENLNIYSLVQSIQKSLRLLTVAIKNIAVSVLFQLACMPCNWHYISIRWTALKVQNWLPSKCNPLWENRPLWKICKNCVFVTIRCEIQWRSLWYLNHAIYMLYNWVMTQKMNLGHLSTCHQFLEKQSVKVVCTLMFNVSVYLYVGPCHTWAVCAS